MPDGQDGSHATANGTEFVYSEYIPVQTEGWRKIDSFESGLKAQGFSKMPYMDLGIFKSEFYERLNDLKHQGFKLHISFDPKNRSSEWNGKLLDVLEYLRQEKISHKFRDPAQGQNVNDLSSQERKFITIYPAEGAFGKNDDATVVIALKLKEILKGVPAEHPEIENELRLFDGLPIYLRYGIHGFTQGAADNSRFGLAKDLLVDPDDPSDRTKRIKDDREKDPDFSYVVWAKEKIITSLKSNEDPNVSARSASAQEVHSDSTLTPRPSDRSLDRLRAISYSDVLAAPAGEIRDAYETVANDNAIKKRRGPEFGVLTGLGQAIDKVLEHQRPTDVRSESTKSATPRHAGNHVSETNPAPRPWNNESLWQDTAARKLGWTETWPRELSRSPDLSHEQLEAWGRLLSRVGSEGDWDMIKNFITNQEHERALRADREINRTQSEDQQELRGRRVSHEETGSRGRERR